MISCDPAEYQPAISRSGHNSAREGSSPGSSRAAIRERPGVPRYGRACAVLMDDSTGRLAGRLADSGGAGQAGPGPAGLPFFLIGGG